MRSNNDEIDVVGSRMVHDGGPCGDVSVDGVLNRRRRIAYRILPQLLEGRQSFFFRFRSSRRTFVRLLMKNEGIKHVQRRTGAPSQIVCEREPCGRTAAEISGQQDVVEVEHPSLKVYSTRDGSVKYLYSRVLPDRTTKRPARFAPTPFPEHPYTPDDHTVDTSRLLCWGHPPSDPDTHAPTPPLCSRPPVRAREPAPPSPARLPTEPAALASGLSEGRI